MAYGPRIVAVIVWAAVVLLLSSCKSDDGVSKATLKSPFAEHIYFESAVYFPVKAPDDPVKVAERLIAQDYPGVTISSALPDEPATICVWPRLEADVPNKYRPPDPVQLGYFGHGLSREQVESLQECQQALVLTFSYPKDKLWGGLRTACSIVSRLARETGGLVWDEETREVFTPDAWDDKRIIPWTEDVPNVSDHIVIHAYKKTEYVRAITLGMAKLGLPDVVVEDFSWANQRTMSHLMNLFAQAMAEGAPLPKKEPFTLELAAIKHEKLRQAHTESLMKNAVAIARLSLSEGRREDGDPKNRLTEIGFDCYSGPDRYAKQEKLLSEFFGSEDAVTPVKQTEELRSTSQKAKQKLPGLRKAFEEGLAPGEYILVKAPFKVPKGGSEWMWVEVTAWNGNEVKGLLRNEPHNIPGLHPGQQVTVSQDDVFDYLRTYPDGRQEGNETGKIIERQSRGN